MDDFSVDIANGITSNMLLPDLNRHFSQVAEKHAPVCQRKVRQRRPSPWYSSVADQLRELKRERRRAERRWRFSRLTIHKQLYDAAKQKVHDLVHDAKTSFYSTMMSSRLVTVSSYSLATHFSPLHRFLNNLLKRLSFRLSPRLPCLIRYQLNFSTKPLKLEILLPTITNILNESLLSGTVPSEFKTAVVKPLLKKLSLDPNVLKNYRSISNLPFLSKLLENLFFNNFSHIC